jgi:hypothetical protein
VTIKALLASGMLLKTGASLGIEQIPEPWAKGAHTRVRPAVSDDISSEINQ